MILKIRQHSEGVELGLEGSAVGMDSMGLYAYHPSYEDGKSLLGFVSSSGSFHPCRLSAQDLKLGFKAGQNGRFQCVGGGE